MFSDEQKRELSAALDKRRVSTRKQAGMNLSYIEGWWAISEANRIFGFDGWDRHTELMKLGEPEQVSDKWRVRYMAKVKIVVRAGETTITRDGCGYGSGVAKDLGDAHESAIKEAETDAMKRALMTFGNPFGLALYDKTQENVVDGGWMGPLNKSTLGAKLKAVAHDLNQCTDIDEFEGILADNLDVLEQGRIDLPEWMEGNAHLGGDRRGLEAMIDEKRKELTQ